MQTYQLTRCCNCHEDDEVRQITSYKFLSNQQKSSYLPLVYLESLCLSIFFHSDVYMIENESFWEGETCLFFFF